MNNRLQRGTVLPLVALCLAALMGFGGLAVDVGYLEYRQQAQQSATDSAAIGGAQQLLYKGCPNQSSALAAAQADAASNGFANAGNVGVVVHNPPTSGPFINNNCAVAVSITSQKVTTWFSKLFSVFSAGATETTQAVGLVSYTNNDCVYLLNTTQPSDLSNANINAATCGIIINDSANFSDSTLAFASILYAGTGNNLSGATFVDATPAPSLPVSDPCREIPGCAYLTANPPPTTGGIVGIYSANNLTIGQANTTTVFSTLTISGKNETICGLIEITGNQLHMNGGATITSCSSGVTIAMSSNTSDTNFGGGGTTLSFTAPSTGNTANIAMFRVSSQAAAVDFSTCTCSFGGVVYFPTAKVDVSNTGAGYSVLIFGQGNFSNSSNLVLGPPVTNGTYVGQAVLGE